MFIQNNLYDRVSLSALEAPSGSESHFSSAIEVVQPGELGDKLEKIQSYEKVLLAAGFKIPKTIAAPKGFLPPKETVERWVSQLSSNVPLIVVRSSTESKGTGEDPTFVCKADPRVVSDAIIHLLDRGIPYFLQPYIGDQLEDAMGEETWAPHLGGIGFTDSQFSFGPYLRVLPGHPVGVSMYPLGIVVTSDTIQSPFANVLNQMPHDMVTQSGEESIIDIHHHNSEGRHDSREFKFRHLEGLPSLQPFRPNPVRISLAFSKLQALRVLTPEMPLYLEFGSLNQDVYAFQVAEHPPKISEIEFCKDKALVTGFALEGEGTRSIRYLFINQAPPKDIAKHSLVIFHRAFISYARRPEEIKAAAGAAAMMIVRARSNDQANPEVGSIGQHVSGYLDKSGTFLSFAYLNSFPLLPGDIDLSTLLDVSSGHYMHRRLTPTASVANIDMFLKQDGVFMALERE